MHAFINVIENVCFFYCLLLFLFLLDWILGFKKKLISKHRLHTKLIAEQQKPKNDKFKLLTHTLKRQSERQNLKKFQFYNNIELK